MAKKLKETYRQTYIHTYIHTDRIPLVVLSAAVAAKNTECSSFGRWGKNKARRFRGEKIKRGKGKPENIAY